MNIPEIAKCPGCRAKVEVANDVKSHPGDNPRVQVCCFLCDYRGPSRYLVEDAVYAHNAICRQPTPEAANTVYVYACPFCNECKDGPTSLREHLLTCDVFSDAVCGAPLLFVIQRRGRIIPQHYMLRANAELAINNHGGTIIPVYHHPAHPPKPEPTEATIPISTLRGLAEEFRLTGVGSDANKIYCYCARKLEGLVNG